jgi:hypothetical protein
MNSAQKKAYKLAKKMFRLSPISKWFDDETKKGFIIETSEFFYGSSIETLKKFQNPRTGC